MPIDEFRHQLRALWRGAFFALVLGVACEGSSDQRSQYDSVQSDPREGGGAGAEEGSGTAGASSVPSGASPGAGGRRGADAEAGAEASKVQPSTAPAIEIDPAMRGACPDNLLGATLVEVPHPLGGSYCVESTEVTNAQYAAFLAANVPPQATTGSPEACAWNDSHVPSCAWPAPRDKDRHPVVCVDWCDARAYCEWAGKRICGRTGAGALMELQNACAGGWNRPNVDSEFYFGAKPFPYEGLQHQTDACNGLEAGFGTTLPVGELKGCEGGFPGLFDMVGNVWEIEYDADAGWPQCRGGSFSRSMYELRGSGLSCADFMLSCGTAEDGREDVGFRCCADR